MYSTSILDVEGNVAVPRPLQVVHSRGPSERREDRRLSHPPDQQPPEHGRLPAGDRGASGRHRLPHVEKVR